MKVITVQQEQQAAIKAEALAVLMSDERIYWSTAQIKALEDACFAGFCLGAKTALETPEKITNERAA